MDVKTLAKSKRAHSQHHSKKPHPNQKSKPPEVGSAKKALGKQVIERTRQSQGASALPSNRDRYGEEFDLGSEDPSDDGASQASDVIVPKSKGADYCHLISEAQSQSWSNPNGFRSLDDVLPGDFFQGGGSMLSVKGEGILSWLENDNFVVEDRTTASHEASFLSLNLHALAEQLAKVDLSQRLFIEADLLPPELCVEGSNASGNQKSDQMQTMCKSKAATRISKDSAFNESSERVTKFTPFDFGSNHIDVTLYSQESDLVNQVKNDSSSSRFGKSGESAALESSAQFDENLVAVSKKKLSTFEAATAEAELDMLLDSFTDTKFVDSSGFKSGITFPDSRQEASVALPQLSRKGPDSSKAASITANFDDVLDDLLEETSNLMNKNSSSHPRDVEAVQHAIQSSSSAHSVAKPKVLDDFDSWLDTI